jgi:hypothetical protein
LRFIALRLVGAIIENEREAEKHEQRCQFADAGRHRFHLHDFLRAAMGTSPIVHAMMWGELRREQ